MKTKHIILAEDDEDDRLLFVDFINNRNDIQLQYIAENGMEVLGYLASIKEPANFPDLIVLDQNMPKMNGSQTLDALKADKRLSEIPVAIYTTYSDKTLTRESHDAGVVLVIEKPVTLSGYHQMMDQFVAMMDNIRGTKK